MRTNRLSNQKQKDFGSLEQKGFDMPAEAEPKALKEGHNQMIRGRWYALGEHQIVVTTSTIRGVAVEVRPRIDTERSKSVE